MVNYYGWRMKSSALFAVFVLLCLAASTTASRAEDGPREESEKEEPGEQEGEISRGEKESNSHSNSYTTRTISKPNHRTVCVDAFWDYPYPGASSSLQREKECRSAVMHQPNALPQPPEFFSSWQSMNKLNM